MSNHTTSAQRYNAKMDKIFDTAKALKITEFSAQWESEQGYKPAAFQKAFAAARWCEPVRSIIDALVAMRV